MLAPLLVALPLLAHAASGESKKTLDAALAQLKQQCGAAAAVVEVDLTSLGKRYERDSWLRDDDTAYQRCAQLLESTAALCGATRQTVWSALDRRAVENDRTLDLSTLAPLKKVRCTVPSYLPALEAVVAKHPEWPAGDRWTNAGKLHWDEAFQTRLLAPEVTLQGDVLSVGYFSGTINPDDVQEKLTVLLLDAEYARVTRGGPIGATGRFAVLSRWMDKELKAFNEECGTQAKVEVDWVGLERGWPGWDRWADKAMDNVLEDVAVAGFVERVLVDLADLCRNDGDEKYTALKGIKRFRVTSDPRGARVMEEKRKKPKKSIETISKELFPDESYLTPTLQWQGDTLTYGLWVQVVNPTSAREWLDGGELAKHATR